MLSVRCRIQSRDVGTARLKYHHEVDASPRQDANGLTSSLTRHSSNDNVDSVLSHRDPSHTASAPQPDKSPSGTSPPNRTSGTWPFSMKTKRDRSKKKEERKAEPAPRRQPVVIRDGKERYVDGIGRSYTPPPKHAEYPGLF